MNIDPILLKSKGAQLKMFDKNEVIFYEGEPARYYYQVEKGSVKMFNDNSEGKQFMQGLFYDGDSFGEPPLFIIERYPSTAVAISRVTVFRLGNEEFLEMLTRHHDLLSQLLLKFAERLYNKAVTAAEIVNHAPESRILSFLDHYKKKMHTNQKVEIPFTRQLIADFTGLRVETVIRTMRSLKEEGKIDIINRKVIY